MKIYISLLSVALALCTFGATVPAQNSSNMIEEIFTSAKADGIDLTVLDFLDEVLEEIADTYNASLAARCAPDPLTPRQAADIIDVHTHIIPLWYKKLVPLSAGNPTPAWNLTGYMSFMASSGITHSIFSFSSPGANVFKGSKTETVALARAMNQHSATIVKTDPNKLDFFATVPLPYTQAAITEAKHAINVLSAVGIILLTNYEGLYLGNEKFRPFFDALNNMGNKVVIFIHPAIPYIKVNGELVEANPTVYPTGNVEFVFETARTAIDLTLTQTIHNFTNLHFIIPHAGGTFPSTIDRVLKLSPELYDSSLDIYRTRFWWDSAGPTYLHQISGLLGYNIPKSQLVFGSDFPFLTPSLQTQDLEAIRDSPLLTSDEKTALLNSNIEALFGL